MELKTKIEAQEGQQDLVITRAFDLSVELLFRAYIEPAIIEQWMGTRVLKLDNKKHGSWQFETTDAKGNKHRFSGVIHEFVPNRKIIRTFEMENTPFPVQLEFLEFKQLTDETSILVMHIIYKSVSDRERMLALPFAQGINMAHNRLEQIIQSTN